MAYVLLQIGACATRGMLTLTALNVQMVILVMEIYAQNVLLAIMDHVTKSLVSVFAAAPSGQVLYVLYVQKV